MLDVDPITSLAFSMRANQGVYALLLGSGISRAAGIPTGWEIVLDLIRRIAAAEGADSSEEPDQWFREKFSKEPDYSDLLDRLCRTPAERQQLLKTYFEPTSDEQENGLKQPTDAHSAIAELMKAGLVRVVITTNFDRLLEQALEKKGVVPTVIWSADQAQGMAPLTHQKHCIIKIHGDYLDPRILNTEEELKQYDPAMSELVARVFDEFGMVVCGWSATWDPALRALIEKTVNRRYSWYWGQVGTLTSAAQDLIQRRQAHSITISSADHFFVDLESRIKGLEAYDRPHPLTVAAAVGAAKRYLADESQRIRLHDLYSEAVSSAVEYWRSAAFPLYNCPSPTPDLICKRIKAYDASAETVVALTATIARWSRGSADALILDALREAGDNCVQRVSSAYEVYSHLAAYPARLMFYVAGIGCLIAGRSSLFSKLMHVPTPTISDKGMVAVRYLGFSPVEDSAVLAPLFKGSKRSTPMSDWFHDTLRAVFRPYVPSDRDYSLLFDTFEFYLAVAHSVAYGDRTPWVPVGAWCAYREENKETIIEGLKGGSVRYGGKEFASSCPAMIKNGQTLENTITRVMQYADQVVFGRW